MAAFPHLVELQLIGNFSSPRPFISKPFLRPKSNTVWFKLSCSEERIKCPSHHGLLGSLQPPFFFGDSVLIPIRDGKIFVSDSGSHRIQIFDRNAKFIRAFGVQGGQEGQFDDPSGLVIDFDGNLVVGDAGNHRIQVSISNPSPWPPRNGSLPMVLPHGSLPPCSLPTPKSFVFFSLTNMPCLGP